MTYGMRTDCGSYTGGVDTVAGRIDTRQGGVQAGNRLTTDTPLALTLILFC